MLKPQLSLQVRWTAGLPSECYEGAFSSTSDNSVITKAISCYFMLFRCCVMLCAFCRGNRIGWSPSKEHPELRLRLLCREGEAPVLHLGSKELDIGSCWTTECIELRTFSEDF